MQVGDFYFYGVCKLRASLEKGGEPPLGGGGIPRYNSQPISQGVTLLFFFAEKKKRSKKRKEFAFHLYYTAKYHPKISQETVTIDSHQQNSPGGAYRRLVRRNTTLFTLEIGA